MAADLGGLVYLYSLDQAQTPAAESYRNVKLQQPLRIFAADGALIAEFGERRLIPIKLSEVPQQFVNALLDTEDKRFYEHRGIDFISLSNDTLELLGSLMGQRQFSRRRQHHHYAARQKRIIYVRAPIFAQV